MGLSTQVKVLLLGGKAVGKLMIPFLAFVPVGASSDKGSSLLWICSSAR